MLQTAISSYLLTYNTYSHAMLLRTTCDQERRVFLPRWKDDAENGKRRSDDVLAAFDGDNVINTDMYEVSHCQQAHFTGVRHCQRQINTHMVHWLSCP